MSIARHMKSVGYGAYGDGFDILGKILTGVTSSLFEPIEIFEPEELRGAKLSRAFKIVKEGDKFKATIDVEAANKIVPTGIPSEFINFVGVTIDDPSKKFEKSIGIGTIKYIPPPSNMKMILIAAAAVLGLLGVYKLFK